MNKEELIKELSLHRDTYSNDFGFGSGARAALKLAIIKIGKLDELEKVVVPKFVSGGVGRMNKEKALEFLREQKEYRLVGIDEEYPSDFDKWIEKGVTE